MYKVPERPTQTVLRKVRMLSAFEEFGMLPRKGREGTSGKMAKFCCLARGLGYMGVCVCQNILSDTFKMCTFHCWQIVSLKKKKKKPKKDGVS